MSRALLSAGGDALQQECLRTAPVHVGDVGVTGPGKLLCRHVFHVVMPSYKHKSEAEKVLTEPVLKCKLCMSYRLWLNLCRSV